MSDFIFNEKLVLAYQKIVAFQCAWMGEAPIKKYHFLL
jgi:hypothetical protein